MVQAFHDVLFPLSLAMTWRGGLQRQTDIVSQASGYEQRLTRWRHARRRYEIGSGLKTRADLMGLVQFFEARRGPLFGFRFRDPFDASSAVIGQPVTASDQLLGTGDGVTARFPLSKIYGAEAQAYRRPILKPCAGTVLVAVNGQEARQGRDYECDPSTGMVTFYEGALPPANSVVTAGFCFDVPVRFEQDRLDLVFDGYGTSEAPSLSLLELLA